MPRTILRSRLYAALMLSALLAAGCGKNDPKQLEHRAEKDIEEFLGAWSRGEPPDKFAASGGPIQGTDPDWKAGYRLSSFLCAELKRSTEMPDRVRCRVALSLQDKTGNKWDKTVEYDVQVGEKSIITRMPP